MSGLVRKKHKPDSVKLNLVSSQYGSLWISQLSIPIQSSVISSEIRNSVQISDQLQPIVDPTHFEPKDTNDPDPSINVQQSRVTQSYIDR